MQQLAFGLEIFLGVQTPYLPAVMSSGWEFIFILPTSSPWSSP